MGFGLRFLALLALAFALAISPAEAAKKNAEPEKPKDWWEQPLFAVVVRSSEAGCEPRCPEWIAVEGEIKPGSASVFRKALKLAGKKKLPVIIRSPGGDIDAALAIGRMIRKAKLDIAVGGTQFTGCGPSDKTCKLPKEQKGIYRGVAYEYAAFCNSACPLVLASGTARLASSGTYVGVHQVRSTWTQQRVVYREHYRIVNGKKKVISKKIISRKPARTYEKVGLDKSLRRKLGGYLKEMGVSLTVLEDMEKAPPSSLYALSAERRDELKLRTGSDSLAKLTSKHICLGVAAQNCIEGSPAELKAKAAREADERSLTLVGLRPSDPPMTVVRVRNPSKKCQPLCPEWISAQGVITPETPKRFEEVLGGIGDRKLPVVIESFGGDFDAALAIGTMIRSRGLDVAVASMGWVGCGPADKNCKKPARKSPYRGYAIRTGVCHGACVFVLAAGAKRFAGSGTAIVVHNPKAYVSHDSKQPAAVQLFVYLAKMGVNISLLQLMNDIPASQKRALSAAEIDRTRLAGSALGAMALVAPEACEGASPPANCLTEGNEN